MRRTGVYRHLDGQSASLKAIVVFSVVIKVGMVGDSQIGKTSLMVKYVEGSFDEDYIQTLGMFHSAMAYACTSSTLNALSHRRQLHGEDHLSSANDNNILHLGLGRPARIRQHAPISVQ